MLYNIVKFKNEVNVITTKKPTMPTPIIKFVKLLKSSFNVVKRWGKMEQLLQMSRYDAI